jgi:hypothetical protein
MEQTKTTAKTLGVVRHGPLALRATWEILPVRMLRLLVQIEEAEKATLVHSAAPSMAATETDLTRADDGQRP